MPFRLLLQAFLILFSAVWITFAGCFDFLVPFGLILQAVWQVGKKLRNERKQGKMQKTPFTDKVFLRIRCIHVR